MKATRECSRQTIVFIFNDKQDNFIIISYSKYSGHHVSEKPELWENRLTSRNTENIQVRITTKIWITSREQAKMAWQKHENGATMTQLSCLYGKNTSTIGTILKNKGQIKEAKVAKGITKLVKTRNLVTEKMEHLLMVWIKVFQGGLIQFCWFWEGGWEPITFFPLVLQSE